MKIDYRHVGRDDAALLSIVASDVFDEPVLPGRLAAYLANEANLLIIAMDGTTVVAQCAAVIHYHPDKATELYIDEVGVTPSHQKRGIASELMRQMFVLGKSRGCEEAWVGTETDNVPANSLYRGLGAVETTFLLYEYDL